MSRGIPGYLLLWYCGKVSHILKTGGRKLVHNMRYNEVDMEALTRA